ncbi:MAG: Trk system potassium transporter TrkA [Planctomycetota bacterium]|nr:Trk system potassium transporter TrkA [Planctomycetota bacterium]
MHIVIAGADELAFRLVEGLMHRHQVTLLVPEGTDDTRLARLDADIVVGRITSSNMLRTAGVEHADLFVGCAKVDEQSLISCVKAARLGAAKTVSFQFRVDAQGTSQELEDLADALDIDIVLAPARLLSQEILRIIAVPGALDVEAFEGGRVHLLRHPLEEDAPLTRGPLKDIGVPEDIVLVMARRDDEVFIPKGDTHLQAGDKITAMGTVAGINRLLSRHLRASRPERAENRATVIGGGIVGVAVASGLIEAGWDVVVIEVDHARCQEIAGQLKALVLNGDGTDLDLLEEERIGDSSVLVAVTSNDEKNLLVSLLAKHLGVPRIVTRANTSANEILFERIGIDVVRSARGAALRSVISEVDTSRAVLLAELEHGDAEVLEIEVPDEFPEVPIINLKADFFAIIGAILRGQRVIIPRGRDVVRGGDKLIVFCRKEGDEAVREFFLKRLPHLAEDD